MQDPISEKPLIPSPVNYNRLTSLAQLIKRLQGEHLTGTMDKKSIVVDNVDKSLPILGDEDTLAFMIGGLKNNSLYFTSGCYVRVETDYNRDKLQSTGNAARREEGARGITIIFSMGPQHAA